MVTFFFPLARNADDGLRRWIRECQAFLPSGMIPIAWNHAGEPICLATDTCESEGVFEVEGYVQNDSIRLLSIASSFQAFLDSLFFEIRPANWMEEIGEMGSEIDLERFLTAGNPIDCIGPNKLTLMEEAAKNGNMTIVRACLKRGASISDALHIAIRNREGSIVELLLSEGADAKALGVLDGRTPLQDCYGSEEMIALLKRNEATKADGMP